MNYLWAGFIVIAVIAGAITGTMNDVLENIFDFAQTGVDIALSLIGIMTFFTGLMRVMQKAGLTDKLAHVISPLFRKLFPDIPEDHPVNGTITLYLAANMLGIGNAATPFGLKAMQELQTLNKTKNISTEAQTMLLALSTTSVMLIPTVVIGLRAGVQSEGAAEVIAPVIIATTISSIVGVTTNILLGKTKRWNYEKTIEREIAAGTIQINEEYEGDDPIVLG